MIHRANIVWDEQRNSTVHLGMTNHEGESDAAYLRKCVEFYELNKGGATNQQLILERLARIETMLKNGLVLNPDGQPQADDDQNDEIFDDLLGQLE